MKRRAQAALEFLTTYGWAILIILVMIGAIAYFGILNPSKFLPSKCLISTEFSCDDHNIVESGGTATVTVQVKQGFGKSIQWEGMTCTFDDPVQGPINVTAASSLGAAPKTWSPRNPAVFTCGFADADTLPVFKGEKAKVYFNMTYRVSATGLLRTAEGEVYAEVQ